MPAAEKGQQAVSAPVLRSLYRQLLKVVDQLDKAPVRKVLLPLEPKLVKVLGLNSQLYLPNSIKYTTVLKRVFREPATGDATVGLAFETLSRLKQHETVMTELMPKICRDSEPLTKALERAQSPTHEAHQFKSKPNVAPENAAVESLQAVIDNPQFAKAKTIFGRSLMKRERAANIFPGLGLIAHPLSSAHSDRRVMMVVEKNSQVTTGLVLDMVYSYPLSNGNPMFPEVFWGHEVMNGGYCHVDFTMPPTANVSILHTIPPPVKSDPSHHSWLRWATQTKVDPEKPGEHHELLCKPLIKGGVSSSGQTHPTLYYSKVEALPYLSTLCPGQERSKLRVYWGSMRWSTTQLAQEIEDGHWIPVELSPAFYSAYPVLPPLQHALGQDTKVARFPSETELQEARLQREHHLGVDVSPPQTFPPDQPLCRREALWDQILFSLGGEFRDLVGCTNPFSNVRGESRQLPALTDEVVKLLAALDSPGGTVLGTDDDDGDDDDGDGNNPPSI